MQSRDDSLWESFPRALLTKEGARRYISAFQAPFQELPSLSPQQVRSAGEVLCQNDQQADASSGGWTPPWGTSQCFPFKVSVESYQALGEVLTYNQVQSQSLGKEGLS